MGKDNAEAVTPVNEAEHGFGGAKETRPVTALDRGSARAERNPVTNDKAVSASGFSSGSDILADGGERSAGTALAKFPVVANADGSTSLMRHDNAVVKYDKPNP